MTIKYREFLTKGFENLLGSSAVKRAVSMSASTLFAMALFMSCSKSTDNVTPGGTTGTGSTTTTTGSTTTATGNTVAINSATIASGTPEGNTGSAAIEDDLPANTTFSSTVTIGFGSTVAISNPLSANGVTITQSNGDVVITSTTTANVDYVLSGTTTNGSVKIYSDKKFKLTLNGVSITNNDGPAINVQASKRVFVNLVDNTANTLTDGTTYVASGTEDMKGTFFSEGQLVFFGNGSLSLKGNYKHAICSDEYVRVISGTITVTSAASDGIHTNDAFIADGGTLNITTLGDGIQCEEGYIVINNGTFTINVVDKGISASYDTDKTIDPYLTINGGSINVTSTKGEGIETKSIMTINKGTITVKSYDDGLNAGTFIYINGGDIYSYSSSNDGIDSNGKMTITGGRIISAGSTGPEEGFDCDNNTFKITGGLMVGIGGSTSTPTATVSTQSSVILGAGTLNQLINIQSSDGTEVLTFVVPRAYATMLFSSPGLKVNSAYKVFTGGSVSNGTVVNGVYTSGTYTSGTQSTSFTQSSMVTKVGGSAGRG